MSVIRITLCLLFSIVSFSAFALTYYIDPAGKDTNSGTSPSQAWATLSKVNSMVLGPGDQVLFIKGGVWYGVITPNSQSYATSANPVLWGAYGEGAKPLISGFITASGWVNSGSGIWSFSNVGLGITIPGVVTINNKPHPLGRFPVTGYNTYTAHNGLQSITDPKFNSAKSFVNGEVVIRASHFSWSRGTITAQSGGTITYSTASKFIPNNGYTYFIQNHINCLANIGDWCYDPTTKTISMYFGSTSPADYVIKVSSEQALVNLSSATPCNSFNGISFEGADAAFLGTGADYTSITNCTIANIGDNGIDLGYSNYLTITNNSISDCNNNAITCWYGTSNSNVSSNTITRAGVIPGAGENDTGGPFNKGAYSGIVINDLMNSKQNTLKYNTITNVGYNGIHINGDTYVVSQNFVDSVCTVLDDGAGIYTYVGASYPTYTGRTISNNIVLNSLGNDLFDYKAANGIYLDDNSFNITVTGNTVANCEANGYYIHDNKNITLTNNLAYNNGIAQLIFQYDMTSMEGVNKNLTITGNTLVAKTATQLAVLFQSVADNSTVADFKQIGLCNVNHFGSLANNTIIFNTALNWNGGTNSSLQGWTQVTAQDQQSTSNAPQYISVDFLYNNSLSSKDITLQGSYKDITGNAYGSKLSILPFTSVLLLSQTPDCVIIKPIISWN